MVAGCAVAEARGRGRLGVHHHVMMCMLRTPYHCECGVARAYLTCHCCMYEYVRARNLLCARFHTPLMGSPMSYCSLVYWLLCRRYIT